MQDIKNKPLVIKEESWLPLYLDRWGNRLFVKML